MAGFPTDPHPQTSKLELHHQHIPDVPGGCSRCRQVTSWCLAEMKTQIASRDERLKELEAFVAAVVQRLIPSGHPPPDNPNHSRPLVPPINSLSSPFFSMDNQDSLDTVCNTPPSLTPKIMKSEGSSAWTVSTPPCSLPQAVAASPVSKMLPPLFQADCTLPWINSAPSYLMATSPPTKIQLPGNAVRGSPVAAPPPSRLQIDGLKLKWFSISPHPDFRVLLIDSATGVLSPPPAGASWRINVTASNGHGNRDDGILDPDAVTFPIDESGVATIVGLKFRKVTSQEGGHFVCHFTVTASSPLSEHISVDSNHINVRCQRMKCEGKADGEADLRPDDPIGRIPGIGKGYSRKWKALGFHTVRDLLRIDVSPASRPDRLAVLGQLRKGRGALTEVRLVEYLELAHRVCSRLDTSLSPSNMAPCGVAALSALSADPVGAIKKAAPPHVPGLQKVHPPASSHMAASTATASWCTAASAAEACAVSPFSFADSHAGGDDVSPEEFCSSMLNFSVLEE